MNKIFIFFATALLGLRIWMGRAVGFVFPPITYHDDAMLVKYADLHNHFIEQTLPYCDTLIKDMGFPIFLYLIHKFGLAYTDAVSLLYFFAAISFTVFFAMLTRIKNRILLLAVYAYILFLPIAFTVTGARLYRNASMIPFYFIVMSMMSILFLCYWNEIKLSLKKLFAFNIILGISFTWIYYYKEDGIWLLMCLLAILILCLAKIIYDKSDLKIIFRHAAILAVPILIFSAGTFAYKQINYHYFGVSLINNRTEGELGRFCKLIYKIKSVERSGKIWAPTDAILQAFDASETLSKNDKLKDCILHTEWFAGDIVKNPIYGDFLGWVMLSELRDSETCHSLIEQENYLKKVNDELEIAFDKNILQKDDSIQLISSMGGRTLKEIFNLRRIIGRTYKAYIILDYDIISDWDAQPFAQENRIWYPEGIQAQTRIDIDRDLVLYVSDLTGVDLYSPNTSAANANFVTNILLKIYSVINCAVFIAAFVGIFLFCKNRNKINFSRREILAMLISNGALILSFALCFSIAWFQEFIKVAPAILYGIGMLPMLAIFEFSGAYLLFACRKNFS